MEAERQYLVHALSGMLDSNALEPVVEYLLSFPKDQPHHVLEYLTELLGHQPSLAQVVDGLKQLRQKGSAPKPAEATASGQSRSTESAPSRPRGEAYTKQPKQQRQPQFQLQRQQPHQQSQQKVKKQNKLSVHQPNNPQPRAQQQQQQQTRSTGGAAATSSVQIRPCACMGTIHAVVGNCLHCGKIACDQERGGRCSFCGEAVTPPLSYDDALEAGFGGATLMAIAHKDKLLQFDRENTKRTHVHDAQADYYVNDSWMTPEERQKAREAMEKRERRHNKARKSVRIAIDFAGRKIVEIESDEEEDEGGATEQKSNSNVPEDLERLKAVENRLRGRAKQVYDEIRAKLASETGSDALPSNDDNSVEPRVSKRIQHDVEGRDFGMAGADNPAEDDNKPYPADCKVAVLSQFESTGSAIEYGGASANEDPPSKRGKERGGQQGGGRGGRGGKGGKGGGQGVQQMEHRSGDQTAGRSGRGGGKGRGPRGEKQKAAATSS